MTELTSKYILDRLEAELPPSGVELIYVDYNDKLMDSQLSAYLSGDFTEVWEEISATLAMSSIETRLSRLSRMT